MNQFSNLSYQESAMTKHVNARRRKRIMGVWTPIVIALVMTACFAAVLGTAQAEAGRSAQMFVRDASAANAFEIESSRLALQKSQNDDVRQFAQHMIDDHTKAGEGMKEALASSTSGITTPDDTLEPKQQKIMDRLNKANGNDFDTQYVKAQSDAHDQAVALFANYSKHGRDDSLKNFATQTLPTLQEHQQDIHQIKSSI